MAVKRVTALTVPVDPGARVAFDAYPCRTPLLTIMAVRPALLVTLTLPEHIDAGHVRFARELARSAAATRAKSSAYPVASRPRSSAHRDAQWPRPVMRPPAGACHPSLWKDTP
jgi:hypothetical protein